MGNSESSLKARAETLFTQADRMVTQLDQVIVQTEKMTEDLSFVKERIRVGHASIEQDIRANTIGMEEGFACMRACLRPAMPALAYEILPHVPPKPKIVRSADPADEPHICINNRQRKAISRSFNNLKDFQGYSPVSSFYGYLPVLPLYEGTSNLKNTYQKKIDGFHLEPGTPQIFAKLKQSQL